MSTRVFELKENDECIVLKLLEGSFRLNFAAGLERRLVGARHKCGV
jgi:hypothetical protein